jgi:hypothetical protein
MKLTPYPRLTLVPNGGKKKIREPDPGKADPYCENEEQKSVGSDLIYGRRQSCRRKNLGIFGLFYRRRRVIYAAIYRL